MNLDFYKNKISFKVVPESKTKNFVILICYDENLDKLSSFNYLNPELKKFIKNTFSNFKKHDKYICYTPFGNFAFVKFKNNSPNLFNFFVDLRKLFRFLKDNKIGQFSLYLNDLQISNLSQTKLAEALVFNFIIADFDFSRYYKTPPKEGWFDVKEIELMVNKKQVEEIKKAVRKGIIVGEEINRARFLANLPGGDLTPSKFVEIIKNYIKDFDFKLTIFDEEKLKKINAGGILGVARGSKEKPYLVILENKEKNKEVHLIGKGITFDSGGLQLKPSDYMNEMHLDMTGAATALAASILIKRLGYKLNLKTLIPLAENMPSGESYRPGDILKTISGKTIEVGSTDAEGRIILADAIDYAKKFFKPSLIIEFSTLTGASMIALGNKANALFTNKKEIQDFMLKVAEISGDLLWPLPLWDMYKKDIEGNFADVLNIGKTKYGGAIHGAIFLWEFAKPVNFIHIDMAPKMTSTDEDGLTKGSTGFGVNLMKEFYENFQEIENIL